MNPFPGLRPFETGETHLFFGREGQSDELMARLARSRFLAVVGTSGSGKSSLVIAGLLPALEGGLMSKAGSRWRIASLRPGDQPIRNLAISLSPPGVLGDLSGGAGASEVIVETVLRRGALGLVEAVRQARLHGDNLLIVVDQFEELFRYVQDDAPAFVKLLLEAVRQQDLPIYVVLTMRSDFLGDCARFRDLPETLNDSQYLVPRMTRDQRRESIAGPVAVGGGTISPRLVQRLLNDVGDNPDQLPILQHALRRTWDHWERTRLDSEPIDIDHYEAVGGMAKALSRHADETYTLLPEADRILAERAFKRLTERGPDNREVRSPATVAEIARIAESDPADVIRVVNHFRRKECSFLMPPEHIHLTADSLVDISHESLIRQWARLHNWVDEEAGSRAEYLRLVEAAERYNGGKGELLRGAALLFFVEWRSQKLPGRAWCTRYHAAYDLAIGYLDQSTRERDADVAREAAAREAKRRRAYAIAAISVVLVVIFAFGAMYAWRQKQVAEQKTALANVASDKARTSGEAATKAGEAATKAGEAATKAGEAARKEAERSAEQARINASGRLASRALEELNGSRLLPALLLNLEAFRRRDTPEANRSLFSAMSGNPRLETVLPGDGGDVSAIAFTPDGTRMASVSGTRIVLWNLATRQPVGQPWIGHKDAIFSLAFNRDGKLAVSSGRSGEDVIVWDVARGRPRGSPIVVDKSAVTIALSPDGRWIAAGTGTGDLYLWSLESRDPGKPLTKVHRGFVSSVAFSPDSARLVSGSHDSSVQIWDVASRSPSGPRLVKHTSQVESVAFSPDGRFVSGGGDGVVRWPDGVFIAADVKGVQTVQWSPDGRMVAAGTSDGRVILWNDADGKPAGPALTAHGTYVSSVAFSKDGRMLASGGGDGDVMLWNLDAPHRLARRVTEREPPAGPIAFSRDGAWFASAGTSGAVYIRDARTFERRGNPLAGPPGDVKSMAFSDDARTLVVAGFDKTQAGEMSASIRTWNLAGRIVSQRQIAPGGKLSALAISADRSMVAAAAPNQVLLLNVASGQQTHLPIENVGRVTFYPDGRTLLATLFNGSVSRWNLATGKLLLDPFPSTWEVAFSPNGQTIALIERLGEGYAIGLRDAATGQPIAPAIPGVPDIVRSVAVSADGQMLATGTDKGEIVLWDLQARQRYGLSLLGHAGPVNELAFSPNSRTLASAGEDQVLLWDINPDSWRNRVCRIANRNLTYDEWRQHLGSAPYDLTCPSLKMHPSLLDAARHLAETGEVSGAAALFQRAAELDPRLTINPEEQAKKLASPALVAKARKVAATGDVDNAIALFQRAVSLDPNLRLNPDMESRKLAAPERLARGSQLARQGKIREAVGAFDEAVTFDATLRVEARAWSILCWYGAVWGQARLVMPACEKAAAGSDVFDSYREGRGLARALTGKTAAAIDDLQAVVDRENEILPTRRMGLVERQRRTDLNTERARWIEILRSGANPFTPEVLQRLRGREQEY